MGVSYNPRIVTDGLVLCLDAANPKSYPGSGTTWTDLSGRGNNGTLINGPTYDGGNSGSIVFDGSNDYIETGVTFSQLGIYDAPYTMCSWFKSNNVSGDNAFVFGTGINEDTRKGLHHGARSNGFYFGHYNEDISGGTAESNTWYYGSWIWTNTSPNAKIYVNGSLVTSGDVASFIGEQTIKLAVGHNESYQIMDGNIAQVSIYNRALSETEISQNYNALRGRFGI